MLRYAVCATSPLYLSLSLPFSRLSFPVRVIPAPFPSHPLCTHRVQRVRDVSPAAGESVRREVRGVRLPTTSALAQFGSSTSFLPNGSRRALSHSAFLSVPPSRAIYTKARTPNVFGESNTRYFDTRSARIIYWSPIRSAARVAAILLAARGEEVESDWARIQRDANFPADGCNTSNEIKGKSYATRRQMARTRGYVLFIFIKYEIEYNISQIADGALSLFSSSK